MSKKVAEESVELYNFAFRKNTEHIFKDKIYNWILERYTRKGKRFEFSDQFVWSGSVYALPEIFGYIIFFAIFYWLGNKLYEHYGEIHVFMFFMLLVLWRLNMMVKILRKKL